MRLTAIIVVAVVSAPLLRSCLGPDDSKKPWMAQTRHPGTYEMPPSTEPRSNAARELAGGTRLSQPARTAAGTNCYTTNGLPHRSHVCVYPFPG
jgi:hypothetical protein